MKRIAEASILIVVLIVISVSGGCNGDFGDVDLGDYVPTSGETVQIVDRLLACSEPNEVRQTVECYPQEVYFGDTIYFAELLKNLSNTPINDYRKNIPKLWDAPGVSITATSPEIQGEYHWRFENPTGYLTDSVPFLSTFDSGESFCSRIIYLDVCPLEDFEHPFWTEFREKMTNEGIVLAIHINFKLSVHDCFTATQEVLVKPRPSEEMALLEKWYKNTPKELFPFNYKGKLPNSGKSNIRLSSFSSRSYNPWLFMRVGNRKPSDPNNPQTLKGWRNLEASLIPSTMRDEVRLARFRLEYFAARDADEANKIKKDYWDWLDSLPEVQRTVMENYPYFSSSSEKGAEVWRKLSGLRRK